MVPERPAARTLNFYAHAFAFHARMKDFLADFGERRGWVLLANVMNIRYSSAFTAFLDRPTLATLTAVLAFDDEMTNVAASVPPFRAGHDQRRNGQG